jgi:cbb3-type cytochrome oxidase subunit 3
MGGVGLKAFLVLVLFIVALLFVIAYEKTNIQIASEEEYLPLKSNTEEEKYQEKNKREVNMKSLPVLLKV